MADFKSLGDRMALYVNTNVSSLNAQRKLSNATNSLNVSYQRLASGLRINSARDDAAGLLISNRLTSQINGLDQGNRNTNDAIALAQVIEGALEETNNMLQRIRTLAVQSANGTYTDADRLAMQQEVTELCHEISRIAEKTTFAGARILDGAENMTEEPANSGNYPYTNKVNPLNLLGEDGRVTFQVGSNHHDTIDLDLFYGFSMTGIAQACGWKIVEMTDKYPGLPMDPEYDYFDTPYSSLSAAINIPNQDYHYDHIGITPEQSKTQTGLVREVVKSGTWDQMAGVFITKPESYLRWSVSADYTSQLTLKNIDKFIQYVDSKRADLGALQNRMESTIRNQSSISTNESDARSRIRDTDFASETATLTKNNIIQQASQSVLTQANQRPTIALSLMGN